MNDPIIIREGAAVRTSEELVQVFVHDAASVVFGEGTDDQESRVNLLRIDIDYEISLADDADLDVIDQLAFEAEQLLSELGYWVEWNDGYLIYKQED